MHPITCDSVKSFHNSQTNHDTEMKLTSIDSFRRVAEGSRSPRLQILSNQLIDHYTNCKYHSLCNTTWIHQWVSTECPRNKSFLSLACMDKIRFSEVLILPEVLTSCPRSFPLRPEFAPRLAPSAFRWPRPPPDAVPANLAGVWKRWRRTAVPRNCDSGRKNASYATSWPGHWGLRAWIRISCGLFLC